MELAEPRLAATLQRLYFYAVAPCGSVGPHEFRVALVNQIFTKTKIKNQMIPTNVFR
jgi:hypothetical protein